MNRQELIEKLTDLGVSPSDYSLDGPFIDGVMLEYAVNYLSDNKKYSVWLVFDHERGNRWNEKTFLNEGEAYNDICQRLIRYYKINRQPPASSST